MKSLVITTQLCLALVLAGCTTTIGSEYVYQDVEERRAANEEMIRAYQNDQIANGVVRQKTIYAYHFVPDAPSLTELGVHDLSILAAHYKDNVLPYLTQREVLKEVKIHFDYNKAAIRSDAVSHLEEAIKLLADNPNAELVITGHADVRGSDEYNDVLGAQRAEAVKQYMAEHNVATDRVRIVSRGEMDAMAPESDEDGMQADRNAHFMVGEMLGGFPVDLNVKRGGVSEALYMARKKTVRTYLRENGVDVDHIALRDGMPGGDGMASEQAVVVLLDSYSSAPSSAGSSSSAAVLTSGTE